MPCCGPVRWTTSARRSCTPNAIVADQRTPSTTWSTCRDLVDGLQADATAAQSTTVAAAATWSWRSRPRSPASANQQAAVQQQIAGSRRPRSRSCWSRWRPKRDEYTRPIAEIAQVSDGISAHVGRIAEKGESCPLHHGRHLPVADPGSQDQLAASARGPTRCSAWQRMHHGVDINGTTGTPIRAPADGTVLIAGEVSGYGNCTVIDHGNGLGTLYGHQSAVRRQGRRHGQARPDHRLRRQHRLLDRAAPALGGPRVRPTGRSRPVHRPRLTVTFGRGGRPAPHAGADRRVLSGQPAGVPWLIVAIAIDAVFVWLCVRRRDRRRAKRESSLRSADGLGGAGTG